MPSPESLAIELQGYLMATTSPLGILVATSSRLSPDEALAAMHLQHYLAKALSIINQLVLDLSSEEAACD